jgi:hypothetical protein
MSDDLDRLLHLRGKYHQALADLERELRAYANRIHDFLTADPPPFPPREDEDRADSDPPLREARP